MIFEAKFGKGEKVSSNAFDTFLQITCCFDFLNVLEDNCGTDILNRRIKRKSWIQNAAKKAFRFSYTFLQKMRCFDFLSILEENCGADIINGTIKFNCETLVDKRCKKRPLSKLYLPTKVKSFQSFLYSSIILKKILCLQNQRFWGNQCLKVLMTSKCDEENNSFTNQVVKVKIFFHVFFVKSNGFWI